MKQRERKTEVRKGIILGITGHRDKQADWNDLRTALEWYDLDGKLTVIHGGAVGFDTQVSKVIKRLNSKYGHSIKEVVIRPDYKNIDNKKFAPLKRNEEIVQKSDIILALYDGRLSGGTYYTLNLAKAQEKDTYILNPIN